LTTGKELAEQLAGEFLRSARDILSMPLKECTEAIQKSRGGSVLDVYEAAEAARIIFTNAYQVHHRLMSVANSMRIEDVG